MKTILFKDFIKLQRGFDLPKSQFISGIIPVVGSTSILGYHNEAKAKGPGVVTGRSGTLGVIQYIDADYWPHNTSLWVKDFMGNNPKFVYYMLRCMDLSKYNSGGAVPTLNRNVLDNIELRIPIIDIQNKIVNIISKYDDLIENNLKRIKLLEETAELLYKEWFVNFRFPEYEKCEFVDGIPEGWEKCRLIDIVTTQYGFTESSLEEDTGVKYLRGTDINKSSYINWATVPWCNINEEEINKYRLNKYDIVVIRMADPGKVGIIESDIKAVFASYLIRLNIKCDFLKPYYLFYFLNSNYYQQFISQASTGATRKSANAKLITDVDIIIAPKEIIEQFELRVTNLREMLNNLLQQNQSLKQARDILIPKLIKGEIEV